MLRQIKLLLALQLRGLGGWNVFRHSKDPKTRRRWLLQACIWGVVGIVCIAYLAGFSLGLAALGLAGVLPALLFLLASALVLLFDLFRAGELLFARPEPLLALPVSRGAIVASRFLAMYLQDAALSALVLLPGLAVAAASLRPGAGFYLAGAAGVLAAPLLPLAAATVFGAGITAVSARMRHKSLVSALLALLLVVGGVAASFFFGARADSMDTAALGALAGQVAGQIGNSYPPAAWFGQACLAGNPWAAAALAACVLPAAAVVFVVQRHFLGICSALHAGGGHVGYRQRASRAASPLRALFFRELKFYFSSSIYVSNTLLGYLLMALLPFVLPFTGLELAGPALGRPELSPAVLSPLLLAAVAAISPTTTCSISLEGRRWWLVRSLPVRQRELLGSKILVNLAVALPCWVVSIIASAVILRPGAAQLLWLALVPAAYIVFGAVLGLAINLTLPNLHWETETQVVKQSLATLLAMLGGLAAALPPFAGLLFLGCNVVYPATVAALAAGALLLWRYCLHRDLPGLDA